MKSAMSLKLLLSLTTLAATTSFAAPSLPCGTTLYSSVTLNADMVCPDGVPGLIIGDHRVRIELNGFRIIGPYTFAAPTRPAIGVSSVNFENVQIVGPGTITGFDRPVDIAGGYNHLISGVEIISESGLPVSVRNSSGSVIERSRITAIEIASDRRRLATANRIVENDVGQRDPALPGGGIFLRGCGTSDNMVAGNYIDPGEPAVPVFGGRQAVRLSEGAHSNQVLKNKVSLGEILMIGSSNNMVADNDIDNGAPLYSGVHMDASWDKVACAGGVFLSSDKNIVQRNQVRGGGIGVLIDGYSVPDPRNPNGVIVVDPSSGNLVTGNLFSDHAFGLIFGYGAQNNDATGNTYVNVLWIATDWGTGNLWP